LGYKKKWHTRVLFPGSVESDTKFIYFYREGKGKWKRNYIDAMPVPKKSELGALAFRTPLLFKKGDKVTITLK